MHTLRKNKLTGHIEKTPETEHETPRPTTYNELMAAIAAGTLNKWDIISIPFNTVYYQVGRSNGNFNNIMVDNTPGPTPEVPEPEQVLNPLIRTGETEHLVLTVTGPNTIAKEAHSLEYPQDIIYYDPNPANWLGNRNFALNGEIVPGFMGVIHYRKDTILNNQSNHDYRTVLNRLYNITPAAWEAGIYENGAFVLHSHEETPTIFKATNNITAEETAPGASGLWQKVIELPADPYISFDDIVFIANDSEIPVNATDFKDRPWLGEHCYNCSISEGCAYIEEGLNVLTPLIVLGDYCDSNIFGNHCYSNVLGIHCYSNIFGNHCYSNVLGIHCDSNILGNHCYSNVLGDNCYSNIFGNHCYSNIFGDNCYSNIFENHFYSNIFGDNCQANVFGNEC